MRSLASRVRLSEGQLYSSIITLTIGVLLLTGLDHVHGVLSADLSAPPLALPPAQVFPAIAVPTPTPTPAVGPPTSLPTDVPGPVPTAGPDPVLAPAPGEPSPSTLEPSPTGEPTPGPTPTTTSTPCAAQPADDQVRAELQAVNDVAGGGLPVDQILTILTTVDGCPGPAPSDSPTPLVTLPPPTAPRIS